MRILALKAALLYISHTLRAPLFSNNTYTATVATLVLKNYAL